MAQIHKIFYSLIIFLFLFVSVTNGKIPCEHWRDCPRNFCRYPQKEMCLDGFCGCYEAHVFTPAKKSTHFQRF
ncbi:hypothetical protein P8452_35956 [Trifolium repens]|nr:hypothetical protein P8452_35956 [Trifolium repens]